MTKHRGFSLIELTVVLIILAMLSAVVSVSLANLGHHVLVSDVVDCISDMDRSMRAECSDHSRAGRLKFDIDNGQVETDIKRDDEWVKVQTYSIPIGLRMEQIQVSGEANQAHSTGVVVIACDLQGRTPTYCFSLESINTDPPGKQFYVVAGLSGQLREVQDEDQIEGLFASLSSGNTD